MEKKSLKIESLDALIKLLKSKNRVFLFGAGLVGEAFYRFCRRIENSYDKRLPIEAFLVTEHTDELARKAGLPILSLSDYRKNFCSGDFIVITVREELQREMEETLRQAGCEEYFSLTEMLIKELLTRETSRVDVLEERVRQLETSFIRMIPKPTLHFSYHLTDACNLNCRGCWHFAPLAKSNFPDIRDFERDLCRLTELMGGEITLISLFGGEPLLNRETEQYPYLIRKYLPDTEIELLTNGLLLPEQSSGFWDSVNENEVIIEWTKYPVSDEVNTRIERTLRENHASFRIFNGENEKDLSHIVLDPHAVGNNGQRGRNDARWQWLHCFRAGDCIQLKNHKLYPCTTAANAHLFKDYFDLRIRLSESDGIDIYQADSAWEILEFLAKPIPFCRYCNVQREIFGYRWGKSKKEIGEWT